MKMMLFACLLACAAGVARADVIVMRNGDRISGDMVAMAGGSSWSVRLTPVRSRSSGPRSLA